MEKQKVSSLNLPKVSAYWISPYAEILPIFGDETHIDQIIRNPEVFGFTAKYILKMYDAENEVLGWEGKAREKLILKSLKRGWVRIRYYPRSDSFTVNVYILSGIIANYIHQWAFSLFMQGQKFSHAMIETPFEYGSISIQNIVNNANFSKTKSPRLKVVKGADELSSTMSDEDHDLVVTHWLAVLKEAFTHLDETIDEFEDINLEEISDKD